MTKFISTAHPRSLIIPWVCTKFIQGKIKDEILFANHLYYEGLFLFIFICLRDMNNNNRGKTIYIALWIALHWYWNTARSLIDFSESIKSWLNYQIILVFFWIKFATRLKVLFSQFWIKCYSSLCRILRVLLFIWWFWVQKLSRLEAPEKTQNLKIVF